MNAITATNLHKKYGSVHALDGFDFEVAPGRVVGLIGPNGSGKTTALKSILGLSALDSGELRVLDLNPFKDRSRLMQNVAFIADTGILPRWMKVRHLLDYVAGVHPNFDLRIAEEKLASTQIDVNKPIRVLSKGMHVQLHLAIVLAIEAELLILDEPTLGLDILYRQQFYDSILNDYFTETRSIVVTTHEVREIEHILTDVVFIHRGRNLLTASMEELAQRFTKVVANEDFTPPVAPLATKQTLAGKEHIFQDVPIADLQPHGAVSTPNLAELFVAVVEAQP
jgi:ABC-2 type transport system ATP-binding protein